MSAFGVTRQVCRSMRPVTKKFFSATNSSKPSLISGKYSNFQDTTGQAIFVNSHISPYYEGILTKLSFSQITEVRFEPRNIKLIHTSTQFHSEKAEESNKSEEQAEETPEVKELKQNLADLQSASDEWKSKHDDILDKYRRAIAESENMRKRLTKQIEDGKIFGIQSFSKDLLEVADVLEKAVGMGTDNQSIQDLHQGLQMTQAQLNQVFRRHGLEQVNPLNEKFDPNLHDALFQVPVPDKEPNTVVDVQKVGYTLHGRTIRPAMVGVSRK